MAPLDAHRETFDMRQDPPSEILLQTEKVTLVLEGIGDGEIRCSASPWEDVEAPLRAGRSKPVRRSINFGFRTKRARRPGRRTAAG